MTLPPLRLLFITLLATLLILAACTSDNEEDENPTPEPSECGFEASDTLTYTEHVQPIITQSCLPGCHNAANGNGGLVLETYDQVRTAALDDNKIVKSIQGIDGYERMPPIGGGLEQCEVEEIKQWVATGLQE
ncbi:MAG: hypothetical protein ACOCZ8_01720 [Bacteroidota bacterium]